LVGANARLDKKIIKFNKKVMKSIINIAQHQPQHQPRLLNGDGTIAG